MKYKHLKKELQSAQQYSKKVIKAMIVLWFIVAVFGIAVIIWQCWRTPDAINLEPLFNFVGIPMTGGIVGYLVKSAIENKQKIIKGKPENEYPEPMNAGDAFADDFESEE